VIGNDSTRIVAIIPARYNSERLPGKPLAEIGGKPMIQHVYERTSRAKHVHAVLVATDDERISSAVQSFGGHAVMTPATLKSGSDRIAFVASSLPDTHIIVNVQGDEPLIEPSAIDEAIMPLLRDSAIVAGTLVRRIDNAVDLTNPNVVKVVCDKDGYALYFSRNAAPYGRDIPEQDLIARHLYYKHIGLYVFRRDFLLKFSQMPQTPLERTEKLEQLRILEHGYKIMAVLTAYDSIAVDTPEDLERVRTIMMQHT